MASCQPADRYGHRTGSIRDLFTEVRFDSHVSRTSLIGIPRSSTASTDFDTPQAKHDPFLTRISCPLKETPLDVRRRISVRRIVSQPSLATTTPKPSPSSHVEVALPSRNHSPRSIAPPSSFRFPSMSIPDDVSASPSPPRPQPSADVQRILARPTLLAPIKRPISRCQSAEELTPAAPSTPSAASFETLVEEPRRPRKLQRPRSRCSSATSLAPPSLAVSTPGEEEDQAWFVLNVVQPGEGWDEDKIRVATPTEEVSLTAAQAAPPVGPRVQRFVHRFFLVP